jgi:hypothetical protein
VAGAAFPTHFLCLLPSNPLSQAFGLAGDRRHRAICGAGSAGPGLCNDQPLLLEVSAGGAGSHNIQMANCFVPVSANHSDSLSLLKTRSFQRFNGFQN